MKLICIGDSLTFGYGVRPSQRWTRLCAQETGWEIVNEGISGDTTGGMLARFSADVLPERPDAVLMMGGANDRFFSGFGHTIRYFNGDLFTDAEIYALGAPEISRLLLAAEG